MKAIVYEGPRKVELKDVPDPSIQTPTDAIIRITTTNICGSDLHMYEGRTAVEPGTVLGHENMGVVEAVGDAVTRIRVGDRVSVPFNIACGTCRNCVAGWTSYCLCTNPPEGVTMLSDIFPTGWHGTELAPTVGQGPLRPARRSNAVTPPLVNANGWPTFET